MRDGLLVSAFLILSGILIINASADYPSEIISNGGDPVYSCKTIADLYSESNLVIRGNPVNIEIYYQNTVDATYQIEVLDGILRHPVNERRSGPTVFKIT